MECFFPEHMKLAPFRPSLRPGSVLFTIIIFFPAYLPYLPIKRRAKSPHFKPADGWPFLMLKTNPPMGFRKFDFLHHYVTVGEFENCRVRLAAPPGRRVQVDSEIHGSGLANGICTILQAVLKNEIVPAEVAF